MPENKRFLVKHEGCGYCKVVEAILASDIFDGKIGIIDATTPEGMKIAKDNGIIGVPDCLEQDAEGNYKACSIEDLLPKRASPPLKPLETETLDTTP